MGGCEIKEVRYKDKTIWKNNIYSFITRKDTVGVTNAVFSTTEARDVYIPSSTINLNVVFQARNLPKMVNVKIFLNNQIIFNETVSKPWYSQDMFSVFVEINTNSLYIDKVNVIDYTID